MDGYETNRERKLRHLRRDGAIPRARLRRDNPRGQVHHHRANERAALARFELACRAIGVAVAGKEARP